MIDKADAFNPQMHQQLFFWKYVNDCFIAVHDVASIDKERPLSQKKKKT